MVRLAGSNNQHLINRLESKIIIEKVATNDLELPGVISFSIGYPTKDKILEVIASYKNVDNQLYGAYLNNQLISIIGLSSNPDQAITVRHISTLPEFRGCRVGTLLLNNIKENYVNCKMYAETDEESVGFYRKHGFKCTPFQGKHSNLRFSCELAKSEFK